MEEGFHILVLHSARHFLAILDYSMLQCVIRVTILFNHVRFKVDSNANFDMRWKFICLQNDYAMKSNTELQADVQNAIKWEPLLNAADIGVTAKDGIVSLTGMVDSYAKKMEAESAAKKVVGVKALVEKIEVKFPDTWSKKDVEVANEVLLALGSNWSVPKVHPLKINKELTTIKRQLRILKPQQKAIWRRRSITKKEIMIKRANTL